MHMHSVPSYIAAASAVAAAPCIGAAVVGFPSFVGVDCGACACQSQPALQMCDLGG